MVRRGKEIILLRSMSPSVCCEISSPHSRHTEGDIDRNKIISFPLLTMSHISTSAISSLRSRTGVSILECKKALEDAAGDEEKAIELLRKRGIALAAKKAARDQSEGLIFGKEKSGTAALVYVKCETDFVARDDNFLALGEALVNTLLADGEEAAKKLAGTKVPEAVQKLGENISLGALHRIEGSVLGRYVHTNGKIGVIVALE